jgi:hypothetical protein
MFHHIGKRNWGGRQATFAVRPSFDDCCLKWMRATFKPKPLFAFDKLQMEEIMKRNWLENRNQS